MLIKHPRYKRTKVTKVDVGAIQGTINCAILESGIGGSGDPKKKWEEMGERERENERERSVMFLFAK